MSIQRRISIGLAAVFFCQTPFGQTAARVRKPDTPAVIEWKAMLPQIERILEGFPCGRHLSYAVVDAFGTKADKLSVALVDSCQDGAYTQSVVAFRLEHGKPVLAKFRDANRKHVENAFLNGASVMNSADVKLAPEKKAIYDMYAGSDPEGRPAAKCGVRAYVWNGGSGTFDLDTKLSKTAGVEYCRSLRIAQ
jgi:hypothetical protein